MKISLLICSFVVGLALLIACFKLIRKIQTEQVADAPKAAWALLFCVYGILGITLLNGMPNWGVVFLAIVAPLICLWILLRYRRRTEVSKYHRALFRLAFLFLIAEACCVIILSFLSLLKAS